MSCEIKDDFCFDSFSRWHDVNTERMLVLCESKVTNGAVL